VDVLVVGYNVIIFVILVSGFFQRSLFLKMVLHFQILEAENQIDT